jgi:hypothetical protein
MRLEDVDIIEGGATGEPAYFEALQRAINGGEGGSSRAATAAR